MPALNTSTTPRTTDVRTTGLRRWIPVVGGLHLVQAVVLVMWPRPPRFRSSTAT